MAWQNFPSFPPKKSGTHDSKHPTVLITKRIGTENHPEFFMHVANLTHFPNYPFRDFGFSGNFRWDQPKTRCFFWCFLHVYPIKSGEKKPTSEIECTVCLKIELWPSRPTESFCWANSIRVSRKAHEIQGIYPRTSHGFGINLFNANQEQIPQNYWFLLGAFIFSRQSFWHPKWWLFEAFSLLFVRLVVWNFPRRSLGALEKMIETLMV